MTLFKDNMKLRQFIKLNLLLLIYFSIWRFAFYFVFSKNEETYVVKEILKSFFIGLRFDLRICILVCLPMLLVPIYKKWSWCANPSARSVWTTIYTLLFFIITFFYTADMGHFDYLESRLSSSVFENLLNPLISLQMVWQTYNVIPWVFAYLILTRLFHFILSHYIFVAEVTSSTPSPLRPTKKQKIVSAGLCSVVIVVGLYGNISQYPLRWSDAFFTQNVFVANLAMNPIHYIFDTWGRSSKDYDVDKTKKFYPLVSKYLGVKEPDEVRLNYTRPIEITKKFSNLNVVYIVMESMVAYKTGVFGNKAQASLHLDQIANQGWLFKHFYTPTEGTARSMFCILSSIPDINAKSTSSRNPLIINQNTVINGLSGYEKYYFIGGSATWGNIRGVYMNNIKDLKLYEQENFNKPATDVWGLSDLDLFRETATLLSERTSSSPFFALIQTASYHRPYTIPKDAGQFQVQNLSKEELDRYGFSSNEEYNSFRMADYSLGEFFRLIKDKPFFQNTLFIIHGDHGLPHHNAEHLTEGYRHFGLNRFHTPLVFYSPRMTKSEVHSMMITEPDVMPTVLGLLGKEFDHSSMGRNVFAVDKKNPRYAFSYVYYTEPLQLMLYDQDFLAFGTTEGILSLHRYNDSNPKDDVKNKFPDKFNEMRDLLNGYYETSRYLLHNNKKPAVTKQ